MTDKQKGGVNYKAVVLIIDGLGDLPVPALDNRTPLEAAHTPVLDRLAGSGWYGLVDPIMPGKIPNTHSGTGMLMGLLPRQASQLKRGPVEAAGAGSVLSPGDIAMRANFATLQRDADGLVVLDRRAGRITANAQELAAVLEGMDLGDGVRARLLPTNQHRAVLVFSGTGLSSRVGNTDPGDGRLPAAVLECQPLEHSAEFTAAKVNQFIHESYRRLADHPVNRDRVRDGKLPATGIITRSAGTQFELDNELHAQGVRAAVVSGCNTVLGLGRIFGFATITGPRFTATLDTDLDAKMAAVVQALTDHDMVFLHIKAPDICSHDRQPLAKRDVLQRIDGALEPLLQTGAIIAVCADHTTDSNTGTHSAEPVPALISRPGAARPVTAVKFGESACEKGNMARQSSNQLLLRLLSMMQSSKA